MRPTANHAADALPNTAPSTISGKWLIIGIFGLAFAAAAGSWWFRYNATHKAARFWGSEAARLIRDAPEVTLYRDPMAIAREVRDAARARPATDGTELDVAAAGVEINKRISDSAINISDAHGLAHLRNALLDDRSFAWPATELTFFNQEEFESPYWWLVFQDPATGKFAKIYFSEDCRQAVRTTNPHGSAGNHEGTLISSQPIAAGLAEVFAEMSADAPQATATPKSQDAESTKAPDNEPASPSAR